MSDLPSYEGPERRKSGRWTDERIDDFLLYRYPQDQQRIKEEHAALKRAVESLEEKVDDEREARQERERQHRRDLRTQTVSIIIAIIAAAATLGAAVIATGAT